MTTDDRARITLYKSWRSESPTIVVFFLTCFLSPWLSSKMQWTLIRGPLFSIGGTTYYLTLPLFWLVPAFFLSWVYYRVYNVKYVIDSRGVECWAGIISLKQKISRVRFDDIRGVETDQSVLGRILDYGDVELGTAGTGQIEAILYGIVDPKSVQVMIQDARDRRQAERYKGDGDAPAPGAGSGSEARAS